MVDRARYQEVLARFLGAQDEASLLEAYELGKQYQNSQMPPDEVVALHMEALEGRDHLSREEMQVSLALLLETMMSYGVAYTDAHQRVQAAAQTAETARAELEVLVAELDLANQQLHSLDKLKSRFFANMNHELRTPLHAIIGFADDALEGLGGDLTPVTTKSFQHIMKAGKHLLGMIGEILDLARLQSGAVDVTLAPVDVPELFEELAGLMRPLFDRKRQALVCDCSAGVPAVETDRDKLYQVLTNLVSNAHKFTPEGGHIRLACEVVGDRVLLSVEDDGVGIPAEALPVLFEEFRQLHPARPGEMRGSGLGLAITAKLVQALGGAITVKSQVTKGSTFTVSLPISADPNTRVLQ